MSLFAADGKSYDNRGRRLLHTPDSVVNHSGQLYIKGDEFTDGSQRLVPESPGINSEIELRTSGIWSPTGLNLAPETLSLGRDLSIGSVGSDLLISSLEGDTERLALSVPYGFDGTGVPDTPVIGETQVRWISVPFFSEEKVAKEFSIQGGSVTENITHALYLKIGSVAPTSPVTVYFWKDHGSRTEENVYFQQTMPASDFPADTEVRFVTRGGISTTPGELLTLSVESDEDFSLLGEFTSFNLFWVAGDLQFKVTEDVITACSGTDRILTSIQGTVIADDEGDVILRTPQVFPEPPQGVVMQTLF